MAAVQQKIHSSSQVVRYLIEVVTCMPCAGDSRALMKRWVSQGARSPMSTCLLWSLGGTESTLQAGSLLICVVLSRKLGSSPDRSKWVFLDTLNRRT